MATRKVTRRTIADQTARVSALLGGAPGRNLRNKPMPLEAELKAQAKLRHERWLERSKHTKAILAPLQKIIAADGDAMKAVKALQHLKRRSRPKRIKPYIPPIESHIRAGSILTFRGPPYDDDWSVGSGGSSDSTNYGLGSGDKGTGQFLLNTQVFSAPGSVWAGGGVAVWFQPVSDNTYVRFAAYVPGDCSWDDNSNAGYTAHNDAFIGVLIESWDLNGNDHRIEQDRRISLWSDGTGWTEEHGNNDEFTVYFPNDTFFMADTGRWYKVWTWAYASCDADGGFWGSATANGYLNFPLGFCVFEQFT